MTQPFPLGAHPHNGGVRFAVASNTAERVEVCLISGDHDALTERRITLPEYTYGVWHGFVPGVGPGQRYGFRAHGPYDPARGVRHNPHKLLVDPYARRITGALSDVDTTFGYAVDPMSGAPSTVDSLGHVPLSVVTAPSGPGTGPAPNRPFGETVIYELHVRGFTMRHPEVPPELRGSYLGLAHPAVVEYLVRLGVTAVELLPVPAFLDEPYLIRRGRHNYWGYMPLAFCAPHPGYASRPGQEVAEFRTMVATLHAAGIEVLLDVVFNHTCEAGVAGPTLCYRGLDAPAYYAHDRAGTPIDITGCGNTLDTGSPTVVRLVTDALRYWVTEMGVDGFRFDLGSVLGRPHGGRFRPDATLLTAITCDPVLADRKLIAEPWDATAEGYRVGGFGVRWAEWNDRFRDTVRDFWRGADGVRDLAYRLSGSSDLFAHNRRQAWASINFVTAHDGFTARDLVSYQEPHRADPDDPGIGVDHRSWNCGVEGETGDPDVRALRARQVRNLLTTLLLSTGTPMLLAGDERWRTQGGDDNPYDQDNETSWVDWSDSPEAVALQRFVRRVLGIRASTPTLRQGRFFDGRRPAHGEPDLVWFRADGNQMDVDDWFDDGLRTLGMWLNGSRPGNADSSGPGPSWLLLVHADAEPTDVMLPPEIYGRAFQSVLTTDTPDGLPADGGLPRAATKISLPGRTLLLLRAVDPAVDRGGDDASR